VPEAWFNDSDVPTFSPDGSLLVFVAAGPGPIQGGLSGVLGRLGDLLPGVAEAHDLPDPFDLWTISPAGTGIRRLALLGNIQPYLAWSPDGRYIAAWGSGGLQIVDTAAGFAVDPVQFPRGRFADGSGGISWGL
jgi:Tol biopolymer transport system component